MTGHERQSEDFCKHKQSMCSINFSSAARYRQGPFDGNKTFVQMLFCDLWNLRLISIIDKALPVQHNAFYDYDVSIDLAKE